MQTSAQEFSPQATGLSRLCTDLKNELNAFEVCISTATGDGTMATLASSNSTWPALHELQFIAGQGPTFQALETGYPVLVHRLEDRFPAWPGYVSAALDSGAGGVFALPLPAEGGTLAVLTAYTPGPLSGGELQLAFESADAAREVLLRTLQDYPSDADAGSPIALSHEQVRVHQAQGAVMAALDISLQEALVRMRAESFRTGKPLAETALDILNRNTAQMR